MDQFYEGCGLIATFIATLLEGEVFFVTAIVSSKVGAFSTSGAIVAGFLGSYVQGWFKYYVAKKHGQKLLKKSEKLEKKVIKSAVWFDKSPTLYITLYKFMFGFNTVVLILSGLRDMSYLKFAIYSGISSLIWVAVFGVLGYHCADAVLGAFDYLSMNKLQIIGGLILLGSIIWYIRYRTNQQHCVEALNE